MANITQVQQHHLNLIRCTDFNAFDGQVVANGLLAHRGKWVAVITGHSYRSHPIFRLFEEIPEDEWSPDTLWIMAVNQQAGQELARLCIEQWSAEDAGIYDYKSDPQMKGITMVDNEVLVRAWWD